MFSCHCIISSFASFFKTFLDATDACKNDLLLLCATSDVFLQVYVHMACHVPLHSVVGLFQEMHEKMEGEIAPVDPLDVDSKKLSENLSNASQQPATPYGAIPNGNANGKIIWHKKISRYLEYSCFFS